MTPATRRYRWFSIGWVALAIGCNHFTQKADKDRSSVVPAVSTAVRAASSEPSVPSSYAVGNSMPGIREPHVRKSSEITELLADSTSAYRAGLVADDDVIYLLTENTAYRFVPNSSATPEPVQIENGSTASVARTGFVYWARGNLWSVPKTGGKATHLVKLEHQPQSIIAAGDDVAWLDMPSRDQFTIQALDGRRVRTLVSYGGRIETATMNADRVFFVRRDGATAWRIGSVSVRGGPPTYGPPKTGPHPASLAVAGDVYYYDVGSNEVRQLTADLSREVTLTHDLACSPIAAGVRLYCPNVDGMFELARHAGAKIMPLFPSSARITAVAASPRFLVWLNDTGAGRLSLKMIRLELDDAP